jgi:hypothetical protein
MGIVTAEQQIKLYAELIRDGKQYVPIHFQWHELMPSAEYKRYWLYLMDMRLLITLDAMRIYYGVPITVNDWYWGGQYSLSGLRPMDTDVGAKFSLHKFGLAFDAKVRGVDAEIVRNDIRAEKFPLITCIEKDVSWNHCDFRNTNRLMEVTG